MSQNPNEPQPQQQPQAFIDTGSSAPARPLRCTFADGEHVIPAFIIEYFGGENKFLADLGAVLENFSWAEFAGNYSNLVTREVVEQAHNAVITSHFRRLSGHFY